MGRKKSLGQVSKCLKRSLFFLGELAGGGREMNQTHSNTATTRR